MQRYHAEESESLGLEVESPREKEDLSTLAENINIVLNGSNGQQQHGTMDKDHD